MAAAAAASSPAIATTSPATTNTITTFSPSLFHHRHRRSTTTFSLSPTSLLRRHNRRRNTNPNPSRKAPSPPAYDDSLLAAAVWRLRRRAELRLHRLLDEAGEAYRDLRAAVRVVGAGGDRIVFTCRRSSLDFAAASLLWALSLAVAARVLAGLGLGFWRRRRQWGNGVVVRRDRSLGGREVVVGVSSRPPASPLSPPERVEREVRSEKRREQPRLPEWWPEMAPEAVLEAAGAEEWRRQANRLVRAIIDNRITGKDYRYDDAIQLRQLCKISGVKVSFDTDNARDSFYRAVINFVLDDCSRAVQATESVQINGEDPRMFLAGLADNIGIDKLRAATLVCASVAARTRACFLQCWALEIQGKRPEALEELLKICLIHRIFPPEENSAEMEMVAGGLKKNLQVAERVHLLSLYRGVCSTGNFRTAAEALGLSLWDR